MTVIKIRARAVPIALRVWALSARFFLTFFLAKYLLPSDVGLYGLVVATSAYVVYILGMDMYTYTTREVIESEPHEWRNKVVSHAAFLSCVAVIALPAMLLLFAMGLLPWQLLIWFYLIVLTEHLGLEIDRLLVSMSAQLAASIVIAVRQAIFPTIYIPALMLIPSSRHLDVLFGGWAGFNLVALVVGALFIIRRITIGFGAGVSWPWIRRGMIVAAPFLLGTLCLRLLFTVDRQIVAALGSLDVLGAYTLAVTIASGLTSFLALAVHQFSYPHLVKAASERDAPAFFQGLKQLWYQTAVLVGLAFVGMLVSHRWIAEFFGQPIYVEYAWLLPAAVGAIGLYNLSLVPHYALYALRSDRIILVTTVAALAVFAGVVAGIVVVGGGQVVVAVLWGVLCASVTLLFIKFTAYRILIRKAFRSPPVAAVVEG